MAENEDDQIDEGVDLGSYAETADILASLEEVIIYEIEEKLRISCIDGNISNTPEMRLTFNMHKPIIQFFKLKEVIKFAIPGKKCCCL